MGLFTKIVDPYDTMGTAARTRQNAAKKAKKATYKTCPDCQGYCLQRGGFGWFPRQGTPCSTCRGSGSVPA